MEKPIIFSTPMVQAILSGRKTQTRRVIDILSRYVFDSLKMNPICCHRDKHGKDIVKRGLHAIFYDGYEECAVKASYQPGDVLWVRETWTLMEPKNNEGAPFYMYKADEPDCESSPWFSQWRPSIHMPRSAARIFLRVTDVRVERVQKISVQDAAAEGFPSGLLTGEENCRTTGRGEFAELWDSLNAKRGFGWDTNPWVWVITFERVTTEL